MLERSLNIAFGSFLAANIFYIYLQAPTRAALLIPVSLQSTTEVPLGSVVFINCMRYASLSVKRLCSLLHARVAEHSARVSDALDLDSLESAETKNIKLIGSSDEQCFDELENIILSQSDMTCVSSRAHQVIAGSSCSLLRNPSVFSFWTRLIT